MSRETQLKRIILDLEELAEDVRYQQGGEAIEKAIQDLKGVHLTEDLK